MKKTLIKIMVFMAVFLITLPVASKIMNKDHSNMTMEMAEATLPLITMEQNGISYNQLHGYSRPMDVAFQRDSITVLGEGRKASFVVDTYGREVTAISMQVRSSDGSRLIEDTALTNFTRENDTIRVEAALKDLLEKDMEYSLTLILELEESEEVYYYTKIVWSDQLYLDEKLEFVMDFHNKLYDRTMAQDITKYLETDSRLEDNSSFHQVNIHSSFRQITWGELNVTEVMQPTVRLTAIAGQTASVLVDFMVYTQEGKEKVYYQVEEQYRLRYTPDRIYLLNYERTMTQIPDVEQMYANDKILLGITDENVPMVESEDGNIVVFEVAGKLCSYNVTTNKLAVIFSFYDEDTADARTLYQQHEMKILDVNEGGNVQFAVYGYMNRGRHEGEVGIQIYSYDSTVNTIEELVYIPYSKTFSVLKAEMEQLLYLNREQKLYLFLENTVYGINLTEKNYQELVTITQDDSLQVSDNHKIIVWQDGTDIYHCNKLTVKNLNTDSQSVIQVPSNEAIRPLGFMGEDIIYGVAREADIVEENSGKTFFPMYKVCICNSEGDLLKEYQQEGIYILSCSVEDNQITLERVTRNQNGIYAETVADHIMNNAEEVTGKNKIVTAVIDVYQKYVQIQVKSTIDSKTIKIQTPKEVVFEGGRELALAPENVESRYYVYGAYGVSGIYNEPAKAIMEAYSSAGEVVSSAGNVVWIKGNLLTRNQIMAITEEAATDEKSSLAVCLDTILQYKGITRDSQQLLEQGKTVPEILNENLPDALVMDLTGCELDAMLYYVNQDIPVLVLLNDGEAVLVTGFNESQVVIMEPQKNSLYKMGISDATEWFAENGNHFVTYMQVN